MTQTVAIFGGSFDPPHVGHVLAVAYTLAVEDLDRVLVIPVHSHPFDKPLSSFRHRVRMCQLAMAGLEQAHVSTVESELGAPSLTLRTLERLTADYPDWRLRLIIGADVLPEIPRWHAFERVRALAPLIVLGRVGASDEAAPPPVLPDVSSTNVRQLLGRRNAAHPPPAPLARIVPRRVLTYIEEHGLYQ